MKNEKNYIEKIILGEIDDFQLITTISKNKKPDRFKKENPKKPKSKHHHYTLDKWEAELDID